MSPTLIGPVPCADAASETRASAAAVESLDIVFMAGLQFLCSRVATDERAGRVDQPRRLVAMRRMPAVRQHQQLGLRDALRDAVHLGECAVLVVLALHR